MFDDLKIKPGGVKTGTSRDDKMGYGVFLRGQIQLIERTLGQSESVAFVKTHPRLGVGKGAAPEKTIGIKSFFICAGWPQKRITMFYLHTIRHALQQDAVAVVI